LSEEISIFGKVTEHQMNGAFSAWADVNIDCEDLQERLKFLEQLQNILDEDKAIRVGFSVVDTEVSEATIRNIAPQLSAISDPTDTNTPSVIIGGDSTRIDPQTIFIGSSLIIHSQLLTTKVVGSSVPEKPTTVEGRSVIEKSTLRGTTVACTEVGFSKLTLCTVMGDELTGESFVYYCPDLRRTVLKYPKFENVSGSAGGREIEGDMRNVYLAIACGHIVTTPRVNNKIIPKQP